MTPRANDKAVWIALGIGNLALGGGAVLLGEDIWKGAVFLAFGFAFILIGLFRKPV